MDPNRATARQRTQATNRGDWFAAELLKSPSLGFDTALLAIAAGCGACDAGPILERLDAAALSLFDLASLDCQTQARGVAAALSDGLGLVADESDPAGLLITHALDSQRAHPLVIAALGSEIARRAGIAGYLCESDAGWWTAIVRDRRVALVGNRPGDRPPRSGSLEAVCPHRLAGVMLELLSRTGRWRDRAEHLMLCLPACAGMHD